MERNTLKGLKGEFLKTELEIVGDAESTGTIISFKPDREIFDDINFNFETLEYRFREMAFLNKGVKIKFRR